MNNSSPHSSMEDYSQWVESNYFCSINNTLNKLNACFFASYEQRLATFNNWPATLPDKSVMAAAGFYHSKLDDRVVCFHCGEVLSQWKQGDNPYVEHAHFYPHCLFIRTMLGELNIKRIEQFPPTSDSTTRSTLYGSCHNNCALCLRNKVNIILFPCKHAKYCEECMHNQRTKKCPSCNEYIQIMVDIKM